ncbi:MAG TPA: hypothetical protein DEF13_04915 [Holosporales bacterium]|nr:MAG: hypothetical protein A3D18_05325 [Chlamydiae bacterium RIFCSPHIGHO2_02_FULL_49_29]OGN63540.1 MAG: hypothetical protein A3E26_02655 [Chlamydiae bacterium RIFCSPHIGHO2_12_FULL_49_32]HBW24975.1 hypothetical protein [Holosporales bacterium]
MNYTREPIIETIITPKEGSKLLVRSSKKEGREDYLVDSIEVISFGHSFFFRSLERPKSFLLPAADYELLEVKESRLPLKTTVIDRSIKIGGGRQPAPALIEEKEISEESAERPHERKKERRHRRRRRGEEHKASSSETEEKSLAQPEGEEKKRLSRLLPPPPTLIAQTIGKYKEILHPEEETPLLAPEPESEKKPEEEKKEQPGTAPSEEEPNSFWGLFS